MIKEYFANYVMHESDLTVDARTSEIIYHTNYAEPWRVTLVDTGITTMTGGRLKRVGRYLDPDESFCMTYGDGLADIDIGALIAFHKRHGKLATVTAVTPPGRYGALLLQNDRVTRFNEKPPGDNALINGGFSSCIPTCSIASRAMTCRGRPIRSRAWPMTASCVPIVTPGSGSRWIRCVTGQRWRRCGLRAMPRGRCGKAEYRIHVIRERRARCGVLAR
jgi:hypothetical protein